MRGLACLVQASPAAAGALFDELTNSDADACDEGTVAAQTGRPIRRRKRNTTGAAWFKGASIIALGQFISRGESAAHVVSSIAAAVGERTDQPRRPCIGWVRNLDQLR